VIAILAAVSTIGLPMLLAQASRSGRMARVEGALPHGGMPGPHEGGQQARLDGPGPELTSLGRQSCSPS
jgi:hypothetical protein